ncbi:unnamed protein product, partial [Rotaria sp. Silwood1]
MDQIVYKYDRHIGIAHLTLIHDSSSLFIVPSIL